MLAILARRLTVRLTGRAESPDERRGRTLSSCARGAELGLPINLGDGNLGQVLRQHELGLIGDRRATHYELARPCELTEIEPDIVQ